MTIPGGTGCENFQTASDPLLAGASDPHLLPGWPMIDAGKRPGAGAAKKKRCKKKRKKR